MVGLLAQVWQQVLVEPLPGELEVISGCGQKDQFSSFVHGGQAQPVLLTQGNGENGGLRAAQAGVFLIFTRVTSL